MAPQKKVNKKNKPIRRLTSLYDGPKGNLEEWTSFEIPDFVIWTKLRVEKFKRDWSTNPNLPALAEAGIFGMMKKDAVFQLIMPCEMEGRRAVVNPKTFDFPQEKDWLVIPVDLTYFKPNRPGDSSFVCTPHSVLFIVDRTADRKKSISYFIDSHSDLEMIKIDDAMNRLAITDVPHVGNWKQKHWKYLEELDTVKKMFLNRLRLRKYPTGTHSHIGRLFLVPPGGGCGLAVMRAIQLLFEGKIRPKTQADIDSLQECYTFLPSSANFWMTVKQQIVKIHKIRKPLITAENEIERSYKFGQGVLKLTEDEQPSLDNFTDII